MELKIKRENVIVPIVSALLIVIISNLKIDWYFKTIMFPFFMVLVSSTILVMKNDDINKKAFYLLIPIILIIFSNLILILLKGILDENNEILNIIVLPILILIHFFPLINKNYKIDLVNIPLMFKIFPRYLFRNLKFLKIKTSREKTNKILNAVFGIIVGIVFSIVILLLLMSADDYFNKFVSKAFISINLDFSKIMQFVIFFIIIFSIGVNLIRNRYIVMKENKTRKIDHTIIISMLSVINLLFVLFLISEVSKLCGNFLQIPKGYIYSSYAREGFFQLLFVTIINFSIILYLIYKTNVIKENKIIRNLVLILIVFSVLLIFNSYYRMFLYIGKFGFTNLRLQVILFLLMELILFGIIIKKIINKVNNDGLIFLVIMTSFYVINLYICNDFFIRLIS